MLINASSLVDEARSLLAGGDPNPEYERALVELVGHTLGYTDDDRDSVSVMLAQPLGAPFTVAALT